MQPSFLRGMRQDIHKKEYKKRNRINSFFKRAGDGNRTHVSSLEGWCSTIELHPHVVGVTGFEPATSWSQTRRSSQAEPHPDMLFCRFVFVASPKRLRYNITLFHTCQHFFTFF